LGLCFAISSARGEVISVNFFHTAGTVPAGQQSGIVLVDGWNNVQSPGGFGVVTGSPGFGPIGVEDLSGSPAAFVTSTLGSYYNGNSDTLATGLGSDVMDEYLSWDVATDGVLPDDSGMVTVSGLGADFTTPGYDVYLYFDTDANDRTHTIEIAGQIVEGTDASTYNGVWAEAKESSAGTSVD
jgi:hypothetical protein